MNIPTSDPNPTLRPRPLRHSAWCRAPWWEPNLPDTLATAIRRLDVLVTILQLVDRPGEATVARNIRDSLAEIQA